MNPSYRWELTEPKYTYHRSFMVKFPDEFDWQRSFELVIECGLVWYTDGSKTVKALVLGCRDGAGEAGIISALGSRPQYSRLKYMPLRLVEWRIYRKWLHRNNYILSDSQAVIQGFDSFHINSELETAISPW